MIDSVDRQLLHALQLAPRASFARIGTVLDVSEQTVARRYQRMRADGLIRVFARPDPRRQPGLSQWTLRIGCRPGTAAATAHALARRDDTSWVSIVAGGAEIFCELRTVGRRADLLQQLPRATNVLTMSAHQSLHRFVGRGETDWIGIDQRLTEQQQQLLLCPGPPRLGRRTPGRPLGIVHASAVTGSTNLFATAVCQDAPALYRYITTKIAAIDEVRTLETVPMLARVKLAVSLVKDGLLI